MLCVSLNVARELCEISKFYIKSDVLNCSKNRCWGNFRFFHLSSTHELALCATFLIYTHHQHDLCEVEVEVWESNNSNRKRIIKLLTVYARAMPPKFWIRFQLFLSLFIFTFCSPVAMLRCLRILTSSNRTDEYDWELYLSNVHRHFLSLSFRFLFFDSFFSPLTCPVSWVDLML